MALPDGLVKVLQGIKLSERGYVDTLEGTVWNRLIYEPVLQMIALYSGFTAKNGIRSDADWYHMPDINLIPVLEALGKEFHVDLEEPACYQQFRMHFDSMTADPSSESVTRLQYGMLKGSLDLEDSKLISRLEFAPSGNVTEWDKPVGEVFLSAAIKKTFGLGNINRLLTMHTSIPRIDGTPTSCPDCTRPLLVADKVTGGGSGVDVTPLLYCTDCGYHKVTETFWTTDY